MFMFYLCIIIDCLYIKKKLSCKTVEAFHIRTIQKSLLTRESSLKYFIDIQN